MSSVDARSWLAAKCGVEATAADHADGFTNEFGELLLFHQRPGEQAATLYHSDMDWHPIPVDDRAALHYPGTLTVGGWILNSTEAAWLTRCLTATTTMRPRPTT